MIHEGYEGNDNCRKKTPHILLTPLKYFFLQTCQLHIQYESLTKAFDCIYIHFNLKR